MSQLNLPSVATLTELAGKYVFVRASLNVPIKDGVVQNRFRLLSILATVQHLREQGARVILASHIGDDGTVSLEPVFQALRDQLPLSFSAEVVGKETTRLRDALQDGEVLLIENLRCDEGEKDNDPTFAANLAALADIYVNESFDSAHRAHASVVGLPALLPAYVGFNFSREYAELAKTLAPEHPALFLLGGAKFDTKLPLVEKFLDLYDQVFIGGALANDVLKAKGYEVGTSLVSTVSLVGNPILEHPRTLIPVDVTVDGPRGRRVCAVDAVAADEAILDHGPATVELLKPLIEEAKTILWNGPFGNYEHGFKETTEAVAKLIAAASGYSVLGGGDTIAATDDLELGAQFSFLSTAGGAMLTFLETGTLPALAAIQSSPR